MLLIGENRTQTCQGITRRGLVQAGLLSAFGLTLPEFLAMRSAAAQRVPSGAARQRSVILLWMWGGPSHLDTFDPKPEAPSEYRGPYRAISTNADGIEVTELFPELARRA